jgi:soluble lytic murein transglycosylase-like protein
MQMMGRKRIGLLAAALVAPLPVLAREKPEPPPPCPLTKTLRVADQDSLTGIRSFDDCIGKIVAAPASVDEYQVPQDLRSSPSGAAMLATSGRLRTIRITPTAQESDGEVGLTLPGATADSILAMHPVSYRTRYDAIIGQTAQRHRIDPLLLHAVIDKESRYRVNATSPAGARGLMQLMPATARTLGIAPDAIALAESNIDGGARLLRKLHSRYGDFRLTLAAYNAGEGAVRKYGNQVPPYAETQAYVRAVLARYGQLVAEQPRPAAR